MALSMYNTYNRKKEPFTPRDDKKVFFYACGPTVYDYFHIGNARPLVMFDVFRRYLEYRGHDVTYIVNITDIDDKIINRANEEGVGFSEIAGKYTAAFFEGCEKLGVRRADHHPRATDHIDDMQALITKLVERGHAYVADGDVYFDVPSYKGYGKLSGRNLADLKAGARVEVDDRKKDPLDFALWKAVKPGEPSWESPWGPGRPGWHIECSAMAMHFAGGTLDIHAGGQDLVFPHHENELAQAEAATGKPFCRCWLHNGFLDIKGEKMSKSLGNFLTVKDILKKFDPMAVRMFFLLKHYRSPIDFSEERIREAQAALDRLRNAYRKIVRVLDAAESIPDPGPTGLKENMEGDIISAMDDDFNTARAVGILFDIARKVNSADDSDVATFADAKRLFDTFGTEIFGLTFEAESAGSELVDGLVQLMIDLRAEARKDKNWEMADRIRDGLSGLGITLEDRADSTDWTVG